MKTSDRTGKSACRTTAATAAPRGVADQGATRVPPASGIDFVDRNWQALGADSGLPEALKTGIESLSGVSLDGVRVHYNSSQPARLGAAAFAQGRHIHLAPGQAHHLPHEAWHVVQQAQGRVQPTARIDGGHALNDALSLELEAEAMGAKALLAAAAPAAGATRAAALAPAVQAHGSATGGSAGGGAGVIQRWPPWLDRLRGKTPHQRLVNENDQLVDAVETMGRRARTQQTVVEAQRRDRVGEGLGQVAVEGLKLAGDAVSVPTLGLPLGTIGGALHTGRSTISSGRQAYQESGRRTDAGKAVGKEFLKEGAGQALGNIPVVGEFVGMGQGLVTAATGVFESEASRGAEKQGAIVKLLAERDLVNQARERLKGDDLEPVERRRLEKGLERHDQALAASKDWQRGKADKGKLPLLTREASGLEDDELLA